MKLFNKLIVLIASTSFFSYNVNSKIIKREVKLDVNENNVEVDVSCQNELNNSVEYQECFNSTITIDNYKQLCVTLTSNKCQQFFLNPMANLPNCSHNYQFIELLSPSIMSSTNSNVKLICQTDEEGNLCPIAEDLFEDGQIKEKSIKNSCKSKNCVNTAIEVYSSLTKNLENMENLSITTGNNDVESKNNIAVIMDYLLSEECQNYKSSASTIKVGTSLLFTLGFLFLYLY